MRQPTNAINVLSNTNYRIPNATTALPDIIINQIRAFLAHLDVDPAQVLLSAHNV